MDHDELLEAAKEAINKVFGDMNVSKDKTRKSLEELRDDIKTLLDTL
jgi:predicted RNase H-like HicB family nuclease